MIPQTMEKKVSTLDRYLYNLQCCDFDKIVELYNPAAIINSNLLTEPIHPTDYKRFWMLWLSKDNKSYIRTISFSPNESTFRFLVISFSNRYKRVVYLDILSRIEESGGKIIRQTDTIQIGTFLAHFLSPLKFLACIIPHYRFKIKKDILTSIKCID